VEAPETSSWTVTSAPNPLCLVGPEQTRDRLDPRNDAGISHSLLGCRRPVPSNRRRYNIDVEDGRAITVAQLVRAEAHMRSALPVFVRVEHAAKREQAEGDTQDEGNGDGDDRVPLVPWGRGTGKCEGRIGEGSPKYFLMRGTYF